MYLCLFAIEYDPERHGHLFPGPKLEVEYTDLPQLPKKIWFENISGSSALLCWSPSMFS